MDRITKSLVSDFLCQHEIASVDDPVDFEKFCNFSVISNEYNASFSIEDISTGGNQGIDGIGIIVNGKLVTTAEEINDLVEINKFIEVVFVFIQAKSSSKFEGSEIGNFIFTIKDFFSEDPKLNKTDEVKNFLELTQLIYDKSPYMIKGKPLCKLYYITTGNWQDDNNLMTVINNGKAEINATNLFNDVIFEVCDANKIQSYYTRTKEAVSATFIFKDKVILSDISKVEETYLGIIPYEDFEKIISDTNSKIKNIFYDNVRDYLGENLVNNEITTTLKDGLFDLFALLNNGITIVAEKLEPVGNKFTIRNYQIVNGCQTSHVLFHNRDIEGINKINIPIKLIVTNDEDVKNKITIATNRQTVIKPEQLEAFSIFQKKLEQYYNATTQPERLYYERRTNQYGSDASVTKTKIITIPTQIKVFAAMFLDVPHLVSGYYGKVATTLGERIFKADHKFSPYYTSGYASYMLEYLFRTRSIDSKYKKSRYHLLMLFRMYANREPLPNFNSGKIESFCQKIINVLSNSSDCLNTFFEATKVIDNSGIDISNQKLLYQKSNTDLLKGTAKK